MLGVRQKDTSYESALRRIAVFVDAGFWHGCPQHVTWPQQYAEGWKAIRVWEHEPPGRVAPKVATVIEKRREKLRA